MGQTVAVGDRAPDFTLPATTGSEIVLGEMLSSSNVLLAFYVLDFTAPCATMLLSLADLAGRFADLNTTIVGISVDSVYAHSVFAERLRLPFPLASDFNRTVSAQYGVLARNMLGLRCLARPALFLITDGGTVKYRWLGRDPSALPNLRPVLEIASGCDR